MIVNKDTKLANTNITRVDIYSKEDAIDLIHKGNALQKIADEVRGSALEWLKEHLNRDEYLATIKECEISADKANKLIKHSKLYKACLDKGIEPPRTVAESTKAKGKSLDKQIDNLKKNRKKSDIRKSIVLDNTPRASLYLISDGTYTKIGVTDSLMTRLAQLQTGNARQLRVIYEKPLANAYGIETQLHNSLYQYKMKGEWFDLDTDQIDSIIEKLEEL